MSNNRGTKRFNATFRKRIATSGDKQHINIQVGKAYESEDGNYIDLIVNAIPIGWDGKLRLWVNKEEIVEDDVEINED